MQLLYLADVPGMARPAATRRHIMADQKSRGGQKQGNQQPEQSERKQGTATEGAGQRSDRDKQQDQRNNPDDAARRPTSEQR